MAGVKNSQSSSFRTVTAEFVVNIWVCSWFFLAQFFIYFAQKFCLFSWMSSIFGNKQKLWKIQGHRNSKKRVAKSSQHYEVHLTATNLLILNWKEQQQIEFSLKSAHYAFGNIQPYLVKWLYVFRNGEFGVSRPVHSKVRCIWHTNFNFAILHVDCDREKMVASTQYFSLQFTSIFAWVLSISSLVSNSVVDLTMVTASIASFGGRQLKRVMFVCAFV